MKTPSFPPAVLVMATLVLCTSFAPAVTAQESAPANPADPAITTSTPRVALSPGVEDILKLSRAKIGEGVIIAFIQNSDRHYNLSADEIIYLRQAGVTDRVVAAMLDPQAPIPPEPLSPPPTSSSETTFASAPQYVTPQDSTLFVEPAPASTVYLATTPTYYSFYDPWPYWSWWYPYPYFSVGWYWGWGSCNYGYWNYGYCGNRYGYWNNYCYNGNQPPPNGNRPPPPNGYPSANGRNDPNRVARGTTAAGAGSATGLSQTASTTAANRSESRFVNGASSGRPTSTWNNGGRAAASQASAPSFNNQTTRPSQVRSGANNRTASAAATRQVQNRSAGQVTRGSSTPTSVWSGNSRSETASRTMVNQGTTGSRPSRVSVTPSPNYNRSSASRPSVNYQRSVSPSINNRSSSSAPSFSRPSMPSVSRPSMSPSSRSLGSSGAFRGSSSAGASRMSAGGSFRGGGGGGGGGRAR